MPTKKAPKIIDDGYPQTLTTAAIKANADAGGSLGSQATLRLLVEMAALRDAIEIAKLERLGALNKLRAELTRQESD